MIINKLLLVLTKEDKDSLEEVDGVDVRLRFEIPFLLREYKSIVTTFRLTLDEKFYLDDVKLYDKIIIQKDYNEVQ